jgi:tRNA(Ile)-lysidine synthetase-like protein
MNRFEASWLAQVRARGDAVRDAQVLVACSGGGDSMALLAFLSAVRRSLGLNLAVAHAHHGLRPEAGAEAELVRGFCRAADLDLLEAHLEVRAHAAAAGVGIETAARELRWSWLRDLARAEGAEAVATGHTLDDHTETVLVRLARGAGSGCLTPLPGRQGLRWSPLVQARREDLRAYLRQKRIPWLEDSSNELPFTPRNRWRALLGPMRAEAPALDEHLWETHRQVAELLALRDRQVESWRGARWDALDALDALDAPAGSGPALLLARDWEETDLRWTLEAGFRECGWPREPDLLRDLAAWLLPQLGRRSGKPKAWGGWQLRAARHGPEPGGFAAHGRMLEWALLRETGP